MAFKPRTIDYEIQFRANQQSLKNVANSFSKMMSSIGYSDFAKLNNTSIDEARRELL
jgi:hypothetical protein